MTRFMRDLLAITILASVSVSSGFGENASPLPTLGGCTGNALLRPPSLDFCGDGVLYIRRLRWSRWTRTGAAAVGQAHQDDCSPSCAAGHYHVYPVIVALSRPKLCSNGRPEFTRLTYQFVAKKPPHLSAGPLAVSAPLGVYGPRCS